MTLIHVPKLIHLTKSINPEKKKFTFKIDLTNKNKITNIKPVKLTFLQTNCNIGEFTTEITEGKQKT